MISFMDGRRKSAGKVSNVLENKSDSPRAGKDVYCRKEGRKEAWARAMR